VSVVIAAIAAVLTFRLNWSVLRVLGACAGLGLIAALCQLNVS
jgi:chromate transporter